LPELSKRNRFEKFYSFVNKIQTFEKAENSISAKLQLWTIQKDWRQQ
jgi:hypothetical protein